VKLLTASKVRISPTCQPRRTITYQTARGPPPAMISRPRPWSFGGTRRAASGLRTTRGVSSSEARCSFGGTGDYTWRSSRGGARATRPGGVAGAAARRGRGMSAAALRTLPFRSSSACSLRFCRSSPGGGVSWWQPPRSTATRRARLRELRDAALGVVEAGGARPLEERRALGAAAEVLKESAGKAKVGGRAGPMARFRSARVACNDSSAGSRRFEGFGLEGSERGGEAIKDRATARRGREVRSRGPARRGAGRLEARAREWAGQGHAAREACSRRRHARQGTVG